MSGLGSAVRKEWLEQWRTYRFLVLGTVLLLLGLLAPFTAKYTPELMKLLPNGEAMARLIPPPTVTEAIGQYLRNVSQFGLALAVLLTMGAVAQERDKGTAAMMLVKPLSRRAFLWSKFVVLALLFLIAVLVAGLGAWYYTRLLFVPLPLHRWLVLNALLFLFLAVQIALTLFCSVLMKSQAAAGGLAFGGLIALALLGSIPVVGDYAPARLLGWASSVVTSGSGSGWPAVGVSVGIVLAALIGATLRFERLEL